MLTYTAIFVATYLSAYLTLPSLIDTCAQSEQPNIIKLLQHLSAFFVAKEFANFLWRKNFVPKWRISAINHAVLITGCDTGFGNKLARKLDANGYKVFACCLFPNGDGAKQLEADCSDLLRVIELDVTSDSHAQSAYEQVQAELTRSGYKLLAVVNNAGILATGEVEFGASLEPFERQMQVNCMGTIRCTKTFSPLLRKCSPGLPRLVNVTSLAARIGLPGMIGYCVSKCAALSFTDGVRIELHKWNIQVVSIEPHLFRTNLIAVEAQHKALRKLWDTSRQVTRDDYGEQFFEGARSLLDQGIGSARSNIPDVVDAMYDSVTVKYPELHRKVFSSDFERLRCWLLINVLPRYLQDYLLSKGATFITGPPAMLKQKHH